MIKNLQKEAFLNYEADAWFERNEQFLLNCSQQKDPVTSILTSYQIHPKKCLEIGTSTGFRLNGIKQLFPDCKAVGIDPSEKAITNGQYLFPSLELIRGTADDLSLFPDASFDLVIGGFFMYVLDRSLLLKVVAEIDRVLEENGRLILIDFFALKPQANQYHHIQTTPSFAYKQNYENLFVASNLYHVLHKETIHHQTYLDSNQHDATNNYGDKACITLLIKDSKAIYE